MKSMSLDVRRVQLAQRFVMLPDPQKQSFIQLLNQQGLSFERLPIVPFAAQTDLPLSYAQRRLWFLWQMDPHSAAYNLGGALRLTGAFDLAALQASLDQLVARHASFRCVFCPTEQGEVVVNHRCMLDVQLHVHACLDTELIPAIQLQLQRPFDLTQDPLLRVGVYQTAAQSHVLWLSTHHIVSDGWSMQRLLDELISGYQAQVRGESPIWADLPIQYTDFAQWQRHWLDAGEWQRQLDYWQQLLGTEHPVLTLSIPQDHHATATGQGDCHHQDLDQSARQALIRCAKQHEVTPFMLVLAAFAWVLTQRSGQTQVRIGLSASGRSRPEVADVHGFFVNTQVFDSRIRATDTPILLLAQVKQQLQAAQAHQDVPFDAVVDALAIKREGSTNPLFQVKCTQQFALTARQLDMPADQQLCIEPLELPVTTTHFDLSLDMTDRGQTLDLALTYDTARFDAATIAAIGVELVSVLELIQTQPEQPLGCWQSPLAIPRIESWAALPTSPRVAPHLLAVWQQHVHATPQQTAVYAQHGQQQAWSYAQLDHLIRQTAYALWQAGVRPHDRVGLCVQRNASLWVGILAAWSIGAAYVPIDPALPEARVHYIVQDAQVQAVLVDQQGAVHTSGLAVTTLDMDVIADGAVDPHWLALGVADPQQAAYLIYTSGSTGQPKGVVVSHQALMHYVHAVRECWSTTQPRSMAMVSTISADLGHTVLFGAMLVGCPLHLISAEDVADPDRFADYMATHQIGMLKIVPSHLRGLLQAAHPAQVLPQQDLIVGGEAIDPTVLAQVQQLQPTCQILNHYGPTETTVGVLTAKGLTVQSTLPLGRPLAHVHALILNDHLQPVAQGQIGELYIGGVGVAQGYFARPALTAERFIPDPTGQSDRLYRTGDRVYQQADGQLVFVGRHDDQVKIRGYRVELGEVGRTLTQHRLVRAAEVLAGQTDDGRPVLWAFVQFDHTNPNALELLKTELATQLPDYAQPARWWVLTQWPLTANGKLDRQALVQLAQQPTAQPLASVDQAVIDHPIEQCLQAVWSAVLKRDAIGRDDNFFELGGDSILSLQIIARARKAGLKISPKHIFEYQTIAQLATVAVPISAATAPSSSSMHPRPTATSLVFSDSLPLSPMQRAFFAKDVPQRQHWNQSVVLQPTTLLDAEALCAALQQLLVVHPVLQTRFVQGQDQQWHAHQGSGSHAAVLWQRQWDELGLQAATWENLCQEVQLSLDLASGILLRVVLAQSTTHPTMQRLLVVIHHLVVDGVSWRILLEDLHTLYQAKLEQQPWPPVVSTWSAPQWSHQLQFATQQPEFQVHTTYWQTLLAQYDQLQQQQQVWSPSTQTHHGHYHQQQQIRHTLSLAQTQALQQLTSASQSLDVVLLSILTQIFVQTAEQPYWWVTLESHGRHPFADEDLSRTVGWLTSCYPMLIQRAPTLSQQCAELANQAALIPQHGLGFGLLRGLATPEQQAWAAPQVCFNYLGQFDQQLGADQWLQWSTASTGVERDPQARLSECLGVVAKVIQGTLVMDWLYDSTRLSATQIKQWMAGVTQHIDVLLTQSQSNPLDDWWPQLQQQQPDWTRDAFDTAYPLSPLQQGLWFHHDYQASPDSYINQLVVTIDQLEVTAFVAAWQQVMQRHAILRTSFHWINTEDQAQPIQVVHAQLEVPWVLHDAQHLPDPWATAKQYAQHARQQRWHMAQAPLFTLVCVQLTATQYRLIWTRHHILLDGWSTGCVLAEVLALYQQPQLRLPTVECRYQDYIAWQQAQQRDPAQQRLTQQFWQQQCRQLSEPSLLAQAFAKPTPSTITPRLTTQSVQLSPQHSQQLQQFAKQQRVTLNTVFQAAWAICLQRYLRQDVVVMGMTVAGRPSELVGIESTVGLFINTLPLIIQPLLQQSVHEWLHTVQAQSVHVRDHEQSALSDIQQWAGQQQPALRSALFDTLVVFENYPLAHAEQQAQTLSIHDVEVDEYTHYALTWIIEPPSPRAEGIRIQASVDQTQLAAAIVPMLIEHLIDVLMQMSEHPERCLADLALINDLQQRQLWQWNQTQTDYGDFVALPHRIAARAQQQPQHMAVMVGDQQYSYAELDQQARYWANQLQQRGIGADQRVAVVAERSMELVVALLAVLYVGAAYVPLDPDYPPDRLQYMLEDAQPALLWIQPHLHAQWSVPPHIDTLHLQQHSTPLTDWSLPPIHPLQLTYVIYTSGSTGRPKGAGNSHVALANRLDWMQQAYPIHPQDRILQKTPFGFDVSVWEFFWPLMMGATLVMAPPQAHRDPLHLAQLIQQYGISTLHFVPSMLQVFMDTATSPLGQSVRQVICSGEALSAALRDQVLQAWPQIQLHNLYGPTEAAIDVTHWTCRTADGAVVPIGRPIANLECHILDAALQPCAMGIAGELYLGGVGLARGYHRRAGLTAERFIPHPCPRVPAHQGERLYRTGDLARYRADGAIEYLGRLDHQIKIRGLRIELGEIESVLRQHETLADAVVIATTDARGTQLVAYVVYQAHRQQPDPNELRSWLAQRLPAFMLPSHLIALPQMPLSPNGKLDRRALPAPMVEIQSRTAPQRESEQQLAIHWAAVLGCEPQQLSLEDHFFERGGHSLLAAQLVARLQQAGWQLSLAQIFAAPTLAAQAQHLQPCVATQQHAALDALLDEFALELEG